MKPFKREEVVIIQYTNCPEYVQDALRDCHQFHNDMYMPHISQLSPSGKETWKDTLTSENIEQYWKDQCKNNDYKDDLQQFIKDYGLTIDVWLIETGYDFTGIKTILFDICW